MKFTKLTLLTPLAPLALSLAQGNQSPEDAQSSEHVPTLSEHPQIQHLTEDHQDQWLDLFNGENLDNWTPKFVGQEVGENLYNTFRIEDGLLSVNFQDWQGDFDKRFGHLFVDGDYSHYVLHAEFRFQGDQVQGGPGWANRNNGFMIHGQIPQTMGLDQDFPVSIEVQLLGSANANQNRACGNICTPGTNIHLDGQKLTAHVIPAQTAVNAPDGEWHQIEIIVNGADEVVHIVNGTEVIRYGGIEYDPRPKQNATELIEANGGELSLSHGTISIQAESAPIQFRSIQILPLNASDFDSAGEDTEGSEDTE